MSNFLQPYQVIAFKQMHARYRDNQKKSDRIKAILLSNKGFGHEEIAEILLVDPTTVRRWHKAFSTGGTESLLKDNYTGGTSKLSFDELFELGLHLDQKIYLTANGICAYVEKEHGVAYTPKGMTSLLHNMGFTYKKPKHVPGKANRQAQEEFIERYDKLKEGKAPEDRIYFMDGVHPMHNSQPAHGWIRKGKQATLKTNTGRQRININGAYDIENQKVVAREDKSVNAQSTIALLEQMLKEQPFGLLYVILDNARYYRSRLVQGFLEENPRIRFMFLPPYSPNLNIIERLWKFFKKQLTYNKYTEKFSVFKKNSMGFFQNIEKYKAELQTLMTDNFELIDT
jgi:transposase